MTENEAVARMKYRIDTATDIVGKGVDGKAYEDMEMAISALEKQIPKKITHEATIYKCCTCPSCKNVVDEFETIGDSRVRVTFQFCHFCGQALDWNS